VGILALQRGEDVKGSRRRLPRRVRRSRAPVRSYRRATGTSRRRHRRSRRPRGARPCRRRSARTTRSRRTPRSRGEPGRRRARTGGRTGPGRRPARGGSVLTPNRVQSSRSNPSRSASISSVQVFEKAAGKKASTTGSSPRRSDRSNGSISSVTSEAVKVGASSPTSVIQTGCGDEVSWFRRRQRVRRVGPVRISSNMGSP